MEQSKPIRYDIKIFEKLDKFVTEKGDMLGMYYKIETRHSGVIEFYINLPKDMVTIISAGKYPIAFEKHEFDILSTTLTQAWKEYVKKNQDVPDELVDVVSGMQVLPKEVESAAASRNYIHQKSGK